jgi:hypothetical protein
MPEQFRQAVSAGHIYPEVWQTGQQSQQGKSAASRGQVAAIYAGSAHLEARQTGQHRTGQACKQARDMSSHPNRFYS